MNMKKDIAERQDIELLVNKFYEKVQADELLAPLFIHLNWEKHLPTMYNFWASLLLGEQSYRGNPFQPHTALPLQGNHFSQWLKLFMVTLEENFEGEKAVEAMDRARAIAGVWQHKMGIASQS
jgi:hemoglobin